MIFSRNVDVLVTGGTLNGDSSKRHETAEVVTVCMAVCCGVSAMAAPVWTGQSDGWWFPTQQLVIHLAIGTGQGLTGILRVEQRAQEIAFFAEPESVKSEVLIVVSALVRNTRYVKGFLGTVRPWTPSFCYFAGGRWEELSCMGSSRDWEWMDFSPGEVVVPDVHSNRNEDIHPPGWLVESPPRRPCCYVSQPAEAGSQSRSNVVRRAGSFHFL